MASAPAAKDAGLSSGLPCVALRSHPRLCRPALPPPVSPHWHTRWQFLRDTLAVVSDNTWTCQLGLEMRKRLPSYDGVPQEKVLGGPRVCVVLRL